MKIPVHVNKKWWKLTTAICKDALKKPVNNEGMNHNMSINKTNAFK